MKHLKQIPMLLFLKILILIQIIIIGTWCMLDNEWLIMLNVLALLLTYNLYRYERQRKDIP